MLIDMNKLKLFLDWRIQIQDTVCQKWKKIVECIHNYHLYHVENGSYW